MPRIGKGIILHVKDPESNSVTVIPRAYGCKLVGPAATTSQPLRQPTLHNELMVFSACVRALLASLCSSPVSFLSHPLLLIPSCAFLSQDRRKWQIDSNAFPETVQLPRESGGSRCRSSKSGARLKSQAQPTSPQIASFARLGPGLGELSYAVCC